MKPYITRLLFSILTIGCAYANSAELFEYKPPGSNFQPAAPQAREEDLSPEIVMFISQIVGNAKKQGPEYTKKLRKETLKMLSIAIANRQISLCLFLIELERQLDQQ